MSIVGHRVELLLLERGEQFWGCSPGVGVLRLQLREGDSFDAQHPIGVFYQLGISYPIYCPNKEPMRVVRCFGACSSALDYGAELFVAEPIDQRVRAATATTKREEADTQFLLAPIGGVFYRSPIPGHPPFARVGSIIGVEDTLGVIELMKLLFPVHWTDLGAGERVELLSLADDGRVLHAGERVASGRLLRAEQKGPAIT
ncbi:MAG: hypothetical protein RBU37_12985 [Myxococcota bacterium]|jgi:hypothetical protein|nr:hypothetical protein [Myxococcota bacterium]